MSCTRLPTELLVLILSSLWSSTLSVQARRAILTNLPLVSHAFNASFRSVQRLSPTPNELHIVTLRQALDFIHFLRSGALESSRPISLMAIPNPTLLEMQSISIIIPAPPIAPFDPHTFPHTPPMSTALSEILRALTDCQHRLPNLRTLYVDFWNVPMNEAVSYAQFRHWPEWIGEVQLAFGFEEGTSGDLKGRIGISIDGAGSRDCHLSRELDGALRTLVRGVRSVTVVDGDRDLVDQVAGVFRNANVLPV